MQTVLKFVPLDSGCWDSKGTGQEEWEVAVARRPRQDRGTFVRWRLDIILYTVEMLLSQNALGKLDWQQGRERKRGTEGEAGAGVAVSA